MNLRRFFAASFVLGNALVAMCIAGCVSDPPSDDMPDVVGADVVQPPTQDADFPDSLTDQPTPPDGSQPDSPTDSPQDSPTDQPKPPQDSAPPGDAPSDVPKDTPPDGNSKYGKVGTDDAFDIMTWNFKKFPISGTDTVNKLAEIIPILKPDMIAVQEIAEANTLDNLANKMPGWRAQVPTPNEGPNRNNPPVGMLWNSDTVVVQKAYTIFYKRTRPFPRTPAAFEVTWKNEPFVVINVHYKAMGDNEIDWTNPFDEERRRLEASTLLAEYLQEELNGKRVVLLGDFNDCLEEPRNTNVFTPFLQQTEAFLFTDMHIAENPTDDTISYPISPYKSHIDHILITSELFASYQREGAFTRTVPVDRLFFSSLSKYRNTISDHRPVFLHIPGN